VRLRPQAISAIGAAMFVVMACPASAQTDASKFDHQAICEAIKNRWAILLIYRAGEGERFIQPRYLGSTKNERILLSALQISGFSETGKLPGFRSFRLDRATEMTFTKDTSAGSAVSGRPPSGMEKIICGPVTAPQ
jgi:hypothetical protein